MTAATIATYSQHPCTRQHRTTRTLCECMFPGAAWITGSGQYALLAWCGTLTITLHETPDDALDAKDEIDYGGCGGRCVKRHQVIRILSMITWTAG